MTDYCRLCAELKDPFEIVSSITDAEQSTEEKLLACCRWTTENTEQSLPRNVCGICLDKLDKCWLFSQSVQLAQRKLIEIFENQMEPKPLVTEHAQIAHDSMNHANNLSPAIAFELQKCMSENIPCSICHKLFQSHQSLREHFKQHYGNRCEICSHEFCTAAELSAHRQQGCEGLIEAVDSNFVDCKADWNAEYYLDNDNDLIEDNFNIDEQSENFGTVASTSQNGVKQKKNNKNKLKRSKKEYVKATQLAIGNEQESSPQQNQCPECGKCFRWQYKLKRHRQTHTREKFDCWQCHKRFPFKYLLSEHIKTHPPAPVELNVEPVQCTECGRSFKKSSDLKKHYVAHTSQNYPFECGECGKRFRVQSNLKQHRLKHTDDRPYECWLCRKTYKQTVALKLHMKVHVLSRIKNGPCICELCGKSFSHVSFLTEHLLTAHSDERPHKCVTCGLGYKTKRLLGKHQITHTEFEHKCDQCDRAFRKKASLRVHMETHTGVISKPLQCDICAKGFRKNYELTEHRRIHTGEKPYNCEHCDVNFRSMSNFYGHLRKKHGISISARNREEQARATAMSTSASVTATNESKFSI